MSNSLTTDAASDDTPAENATPADVTPDAADWKLISESGSARHQQPVRRSWPTRLAPALTYVAVRAVGVVILAIIAGAHHRKLIDVLHSWDGNWYLRIAANGYGISGADLVDANGHSTANTALAFFPGYPMLIGVVHGVTRLNPIAAGLLISLAAGIGAAYGITRICAGRFGPQWTGLICVVLFAATPMSVTLSMVYSEAMFTVLAVWTLVGVLQRYWLLAACCCSVSGLVRPSAAILLVVVCVALVVSVRRGTSKPAVLLYALVAASGLVVFYAYVATRTGSLTGWFQLQKAGWGTAFDGGRSSALFVWRILTTDAPLMENLNVAVMLGALALAVVVIVRRQPWPLAVYGIGLLIMTAGSSGVVYSKMRLLVPAVTLLIPVAVGLAKRKPATIIAVLAVVTVLSGWIGAYALTDWHYAI